MWWSESLIAQAPNGMFVRSNETEETEVLGLFGISNATRSNGMEWYGMTPQNPMAEAPLGSGLLILVAIGAGYATLKRKEERQ